MGNLNGLVGILLGHVQGDGSNGLCTVLAGLLTPAIFLTVLSECRCASAPLAASLSANSLPANIQIGWCPDHRDHSLTRLFDFENQDCRGVLLDRVPELLPQTTDLPQRSDSPLAVETKYSLSESEPREGGGERGEGEGEEREGVLRGA